MWYWPVQARDVPNVVPGGFICWSDCIAGESRLRDDSNLGVDLATVRQLPAARKLLTSCMALLNIVVIGGSAGALEPLAAVVAGLPEELALSAFVVVHAWPVLPVLAVALLARAGSLRVRCAQDGEPITRGTLLVAPPDRHLIVKEGFVRLARSPSENFWRPAVDVLFRSAAVAYGTRVIGVVLSGALDDGSAGGRAIKRCGGTVSCNRPPMRAFRKCHARRSRPRPPTTSYPIEPFPGPSRRLSRGSLPTHLGCPQSWR